MVTSARRSDAVDEPLLRLGDDLLRAQVVTGIAPTEPAEPLYPQNFGPRRAIARRRLGNLGYPLDEPDRSLFDRFRVEAGLRATGDDRLDDATWSAIDELVSLEADVDASRWRDRQGRWLPAMRRAILARRVALEFGEGALSFSAEAASEEAPSAEEADDELRSLAIALGRPVDDQLIGLLFDHERLFAAREGLVGDEGLAFGDEAAPRIADVVRQAELARLGLDDATLAEILAADDAKASAARASAPAPPVAPPPPASAGRGAREDDDEAIEVNPPSGEDDLQPMALGLDFDDFDDVDEEEEVAEPAAEPAPEPPPRADEDAVDPDAILDEESDPDAVDPFDDDLLLGSGDEEALSFGLMDGLASVRKFFRDLIEEPELRKKPNEAQLRAYAVSVTRLISAEDDVGERWQDFVGDESSVWEARGRASAWLHGAARWLRERGLGLLDGLKRLLGRLRKAAEAALGYMRSLFTNLFRVLYHDLARVFDIAHSAASSLVQHIRGATVPEGDARIVLRRRAQRAVVLVDPGATSEECRTLALRLRREGELLAVVGELLGLVLAITATWAFGAALTPALVLRGLGGRAQRIILLGRRLAALSAG